MSTDTLAPPTPAKRGRKPKATPAPAMPAGPTPADFRRAAVQIKQLGDPTRLRVVYILGDGEKNVGEICGMLESSQPAVSHHLALLRHGGIIEPRRQGKNNYYALTDKGATLLRAVDALIPGA
jgi:DNA-binding transcriptional ArsR family regulator